MQYERKILHVDMDAFYASVEQRDNPELRGLPVIVGGSPDSRGVVCAASYEARAFGVRSAMPCSRAARLCPQALFVAPRFHRYQAASEGMHAILSDYTDALEPLSLDEAYLDVTADKAGLGSATATAEQIRARVKSELDLTCSAGVAPLKFVAKIASAYNKPDGITVVPPGKVLAFIHPLPIDKLFGVGPSTAAAIRQRLQVDTVGQLAGLDPMVVRRALGRRGRMLWDLANGRDRRGIGGRSGRKSRGAERTFAEDVEDVRELAERLRGLAERVCQGMTGKAPRTVTVKVRYGDFTTVSRSTSLPPGPVDSQTVSDLAIGLLSRTEAGFRPVRLIGVSLSGFPTLQRSRHQLELPLSA